MRHILILFSIFLLSSAVIGDNETHPIYEGEVENGVPNGVGILIYPEGNTYIGDFKDGVPNGQGTFTWSDGDKYVGEFKDDKKWTGIFYDKFGIITEKIVNGK